MVVRKVEEKDRSKLLQLHHDLHIKYQREHLLKNSPVQSIIEYVDPNSSMKESVEELFDGSHFAFVAEMDGKIVGFISGKINKLEDKTHNKEGYIDDWYVEGDHRSKGIGKQLFDALVDEFKKQGCTHLAISAYAENSEALELYRKLGFHDFSVILKKKLT